MYQVISFSYNDWSYDQVSNNSVNKGEKNMDRGLDSIGYAQKTYNISESLGCVFIIY